MLGKSLLKFFGLRSNHKFNPVVFFNMIDHIIIEKLIFSIDSSLNKLKVTEIIR